MNASMHSFNPFLNEHFRVLRISGYVFGISHHMALFVVNNITLLRFLKKKSNFFIYYNINNSQWIYLYLLHLNLIDAEIYL